jgi:hypothetical protein
MRTIRVWRLTWFHSPSGETVTAYYPTRKQADDRRAYIQSNGDTCPEPVKDTTKIPC